jgi:MFS family permease
MSTTFLISTTLGPVVGGFFAEHLSWPWVFWINLPLGAVAFVVISRQLRTLTLPTRRASVDWLGAILILGSSVAVMIGLSRVEEAGGWLNGQVLTALGIGVVGAAALIFTELRIPEPMLPMRLFTIETYTVANIGLFLP